MLKKSASIKLLVIEDNPADQLIIEDYVTDSFDNAVMHFDENFSDAVNSLRRKETFDAVLLDLTLPDKSGEQLIKKILELAKDIPVIVLTGYSDLSFGARSLNLGISDYLLKDELSEHALKKSILYSIERKKSSLEILQTRKLYSELFQLNPLPLMLFDIDTLDFLDVNDAAVNHYQYSREEFLKMNLKEIKPSEDVPELIKIIDQTKKKRHLLDIGIHRHVKKNGEQILVEIKASNIQYKNKIARLALANDITERLESRIKLEKSEEALRRLNTELEERVKMRTQELEEVNNQLEAFTSSVSHDLKAPIRLMSNFAQILEIKLGDKKDEEISTYLSKINTNATKMQLLIDNLLKFSKIAKTDLKKEKVNFLEILMIALSNFSEDQTKHIRYQADFPEVMVDKSMMVQALFNLISNGIKYSSKIESPKIEISYKKQNNQDVFFVKDNGAGFDMQHYEKLFSLFKRLHSESQFEGSGIGLAIVKSIIEKHGGQIWAESTEGKGSVFYFTLSEQTKPLP